MIATSMACFCNPCAQAAVANPDLELRGGGGGWLATPMACFCNPCAQAAVANPDLELRGGGGGGLDLLALLAIFPSVISSFFTQNKGAGPLGPSPRSATGLNSISKGTYKKCVQPPYPSLILNFLCLLTQIIHDP